MKSVLENNNSNTNIMWKGISLCLQNTIFHQIPKYPRIQYCSNNLCLYDLLL